MFAIDDYFDAQHLVHFSMDEQFFFFFFIVFMLNSKSGQMFIGFIGMTIATVMATKHR